MAYPQASQRWARSSRRNRCPICGHDSWCQVSPDESVAKCMRVSDGAFRSGTQRDGAEYFLHRLGDAPAPFPAPRPPQDRPTPAAPDLWANRAVYAMVLTHCESLPPRARAELARRFGPHADAVLSRFRIGYCDTTGSLAKHLPDAGRRQDAIRAGVLTASGAVVRSLQGKLVIPFIREGHVWDVRGSGLKAEGSTKPINLSGGFAERGIDGLFLNHDALTHLGDEKTVHLAGGDWKTIALAIAGLPAVGTHGEAELFDPQIQVLLAAGVEEVVVHIDAEEPQRKANGEYRYTEAGVPLSAGQRFGLTKGERLAQAGVRVRIAEPPRPPDSPKVDPDALLRDAGPEAVRAYARNAPTLAAYRSRLGIADPTFRPTCREAVMVAAVDEPGRPPTPLADVERGIRERVRRLLHGRDPQCRTLVITAPPGTGKSTAVTEAVIALPARQRVWFLAPRHDLFAEAHASAGFRHVHGRTQGNCEYADLAAVLGGKGYEVDAVLCGRCPLQRECAYFDQFAGAGHRFAALPLLHTARPENASAIVLDEVTPDDLIETRKVRRASLVRLAGEPRAQPRLRALAEVLVRTLDRRAEQHPGKPSGVSLRGPALLDALAATAGGESPLRDLVAEAFITEPAALPALTLEAASALPTLTAESLITALRDELRWQDGGAGGGILTLDPHLGEYRIRRRRALPAWFAEKPLIILNATADPATLLDLLGRDPATAEVYDPAVALPAEVEIVQLTDAFYGKTTLLNPGRATLTRARDRVRATLAPDLATGLITFQDIEEQVGEALGIPAEHTAHFGAVAGRNDMQALEQLIILGTFSPPPAVVIELASAIHAGGAPLALGQEYRRAHYPGWRDADGNGLAIDEQVFTDERINRLWREMRDGALVQAAHRLRLHRPNGRRRVRLILATAQPLGALPPTALVRRGGPTTRGTTQAMAVTLAEALTILVARDGFATQRALAAAAGCSPGTAHKY